MQATRPLSSYLQGGIVGQIRSHGDAGALLHQTHPSIIIISTALRDGRHHRFLLQRGRRLPGLPVAAGRRVRKRAHFASTSRSLPEICFTRSFRFACMRRAQGGRKVFMQSDCAACHSMLPFREAAPQRGEAEPKLAEIVVVNEDQQPAPQRPVNATVSMRSILPRTSISAPFMLSRLILTGLLCSTHGRCCKACAATTCTPLKN
jgi:hypothetical protein